MIRPFTQDYLIYDWTEDYEENASSDEILLESDSLTPSEDTLSFLRSFARSFVPEMDSKYSFPVA